MFHCITSRVRSPLPKEEQTTLPLPPASAALCKCSGSRRQPAAALPAPGLPIKPGKRSGQPAIAFHALAEGEKPGGICHRHGSTRNAAPDSWICAGLSLGTACRGRGARWGADPGWAGGGGAAGAPRQSGRGGVEESRSFPSPTSNVALPARR